MRHPTDQQLLSYIENDPQADQRSEIEAHVSTCPDCRRRVSRLRHVTADLMTTLNTVSEQVPLSQVRSWATVSRRRQKRQQRPLATARRRYLRHAATVIVLLLFAAGIAGLAHSLAITMPTSDDPTPTPEATVPARPSSPPGPLPVYGDQRAPEQATILIMGVDGEQATSNEVDMLILAHVDAEAEQAFLLSIPRDLYVEVSERRHTRAGYLYKLGQQDESTDGLTLARETISSTLGLSIHHAVLVRFDGFVTLIDAIDGVEIDVPYAIDDAEFPDEQGGYDPLTIPAGRQRFDGERALQYTRTRVEPEPGFDRAFRQRQIILAAFEQVTQLNMLPELIHHSPALWSAVSESLETDLSLNAVIELMLLTPDLQANDIRTANVEACCTTKQATTTGEQILLLQPQALQTTILDLMEE